MILEAVGEDPDRPGLIGTPERIAKMYEEIFSGLNEEPSKHLEKIFLEDHEEMVLVKDIPMYSVCEHHLLPFFGYSPAVEGYRPFQTCQGGGGIFAKAAAAGEADHANCRRRHVGTQSVRGVGRH